LPIAVDELAEASVESAGADPSDLQPEWSQQAADLVLMVSQLVDEELPRQRAQFLAYHRLHMTARSPLEANADEAIADPL